LLFKTGIFNLNVLFDCQVFCHVFLVRIMSVVSLLYRITGTQNMHAITRYLLLRAPSLGNYWETRVNSRIDRSETNEFPAAYPCA